MLPHISRARRAHVTRTPRTSRRAHLRKPHVDHLSNERAIHTIERAVGGGRESTTSQLSELYTQLSELYKQLSELYKQLSEPWPRVDHLFSDALARLCRRRLVGISLALLARPSAQCLLWWACVCPWHRAATLMGVCNHVENYGVITTAEGILLLSREGVAP